MQTAGMVLYKLLLLSNYEDTNILVVHTSHPYRAHAVMSGVSVCYILMYACTSFVFMRVQNADMNFFLEYYNIMLVSQVIHFAGREQLFQRQYTVEDPLDSFVGGALFSLKLTQEVKQQKHYQ